MAFGLALEIEHGPAEDQPLGAPVRRNYPTAGILSSAVGALLFPSIAATVGSILSITLPTKWVTKGRMSAGFWGRGTETRGLLTERWGRVVVGGCIFVVVRDAAVLYGKWRRARASEGVSIKDWNGPPRARAGM